MRLLKPKLQAGPAQVPQLTKIGITGRRKTIFITLVVILIVGFISIAGYKSYQHFNKKTEPTPKPKTDRLATTAERDKRLNTVVDKNLSSGHIESYQIGKLELANGYIRINDFTKATVYLQDVKKNVPADKLIPYYYQIKLLIDQHNKDVAAQKADLQKLIELNKAQKQTANAEFYQKQLDKL